MVLIMVMWKFLTTDVADFIAYGDNASKCLGVVGSGNRNFNNQYCLTAKQYSQRFGFPMLADFEMRGSVGRHQKSGYYYRGFVSFIKNADFSAFFVHLKKKGDQSSPFFYLGIVVPTTCGILHFLRCIDTK